MPKRNQTNISLNISYKDRRILIVDDEPYNLMALKVVIDAADTRVKDMIDEATNGLEAYEAVKKADQKGFSYGLIFMDCSMPIMDGYQATEKIRKYLKSKYLQ